MKTNEQVLQWEQFPTQCLPSVLQKYCTAVSKSTVTDPSFAVTFVLPVISSAIGSHIVLQATPDWKIPAILWTMLAADSGTGKTPVWKMVVKPLMDQQQKYSTQYREEMWQYENDLSLCKKSDAKPELPRHRFCHISDCTTAALIQLLSENHYGVCASYNELSTWISNFSYNGRDEAIFCGVYDGSPVQVNRKTKPRYIEARHTNTSITGGIQPESLNRILQRNPQFYYTGFLARFLMAMPPDTPRYYSDYTVPNTTVNEYHKLIKTLLSWQTDVIATPDDPFQVTLSVAARALFTEYHDSLTDDRSSLADGVMKTILPKMVGNALRVALTFHMVETASNAKQLSNTQEISVRTMKNAIALVEWYRREGQRILQQYRPFETTKGDREVASILNHIKNQGGQTTARLVSQYISAFSGRGGAERATAKLTQMCQDNILVSENIKASNGRPITVYSIKTT